MERSFEVTRGQQHVCAHNFWLRWDTEVGMVSLCLSCPGASTDMQHDPFRQWHDLDLRSNIEFDLLRSTWMCFEPPWRGKHDGVHFISLSLLCKKLFAINNFDKIGNFDFDDLWSPNYWPEVKSDGILQKELFLVYQMLFFGFFLSVIVSEL